MPVVVTCCSIPNNSEGDAVISLLKSYSAVTSANTSRETSFFPSCSGGASLDIVFQLFSDKELDILVMYKSLRFG